MKNKKLVLRTCQIAVPVAAALVAGVNVASADGTYTYDGYSVTPFDESVSVSGTVTAGPFGSGQIVLDGTSITGTVPGATNTSGLNILAWCLDISTTLLTSATYQITTLGPPANTTFTNLNGGPTMSATTIGEIGNLMLLGDNLLGGIPEGPFAATPPPSQTSASIQLAIWELEYPSSAGYVWSASAADQNLANEYLDYVTIGYDGDMPAQTPIVYLLYDAPPAPNQSLGYVIPGNNTTAPPAPTPLPGALPLFAGGLGLPGILF